MPKTGTVDAAQFDELARQHRRELHVHCYRMTGSFTEAEDLVQETFLRAWRALDRFEGRSSLRTWLYRIATNVCLDALTRSGRHTQPAGDLLAESRELQPYPDVVFGSDGSGPGERLEARETVALGFLAALLHLPPRQRAVLIVRDLLGWNAEETATLLDLSVPAANSLVQRARVTLRRHTPASRLEWVPPTLTPADEDLLRQYVEAHERGDADTLVALVRADVRITMPPEAPVVGVADASATFRGLFGQDGAGTWRLVPTTANGRPAAAGYLRRPGGTTFEAIAIDVLHVEDAALVEISCFLDPTVFSAFGLPTVLPSDDQAA
jgi:RNA polymerase sigma-70 factor (ECF subfamily)